MPDEHSGGDWCFQGGNFCETRAQKVFDFCDSFFFETFKKNLVSGVRGSWLCLVWLLYCYLGETVWLMWQRRRF